MASPKENDDTAIKNRIITHMNTSHQGPFPPPPPSTPKPTKNSPQPKPTDSLTRYLRQTHHLPLSTARHATLHSLTLTTLTLTLSPSSPTAPKYQIPISPPLATYADARTRLAAMDAAACTALDLSPYTLTHYDPPRGFRLFVFIVVFLETLLLSRRAHFLPPSFIHRILTLLTPSYGAQTASFCARAHWGILAVIYGIHGVQAWRMDRTRLRRYNVVRGGRVWWLWMGDAMVEGMYAFPPVDEWARGEEERREKQRH